jgi:small-conductance mechanosensitive channel
MAPVTQTTAQEGRPVLRRQNFFNVVIAAALAAIVLPGTAPSGGVLAAAATDASELAHSNALPAAGAVARPLAVRLAEKPAETPAVPAAAPATATPPTPPAAEPPAAAPPPEQQQLEPLLQPVRRLGGMLDDLDRTVERVKDRDDELSRVRREIDLLPGEARRAIDVIAPRLADVRAQIDKLGPAPKPEEPAEATQIAAERSRLNAIASALDGAIKSAELASERASQLAARAQELRQTIFTSQLLRRTQQSPLRPGLWRDVAQVLPGAATDVGVIARNWWKAATPRLGQLAATLALAALLFVAATALRRRVTRAHLDAPREKPPTFFARAVAAGWMAPAYAIPATATALLVYLGLDHSDLLYLQTASLAETLLTAAALYVAVSALSRAILQPGRPMWRLFDMNDATARRLHGLTNAVTAVYAIDLVLARAAKVLALPFQVNVAQAFLFSMVFAALLLALARTRLEPMSASPHLRGPDGEVSRWHPPWLKVPTLLIAMFIVGASLTGYVALGRYASAQVVLTGTVLVVIMLLHLAVRAISGQAGLSEDSLSTRLLGERFKLDDTQRTMLDGFVFVALNVALAFFAVPLLLFSWGFSTPEVTSWLNSAVFGFDVGGVRVSLARILVAVLLFGGLLFATRVLQRWMQSTVLKPSRIDSGLANSIHTGVGYAGFAVAALLAISYGGIDITNLAIVAGALSVGIGFGLQSIVNNFVSGLILLVERPIKVGDWIVVGANEGYVRRISVRSTEIETFDRSSVIVPNSELITGSVRNRTHRNTMGRVSVQVGVAYSADPARVRKLLQDVATSCDALLKFPAPFINFDNFAASSLDFTIHAFVADINKSGNAASELRITVFKALQANGIEIPFPQTDVHLRDLDVVKELVARVAAERFARSAAEAAAADTELKPTAGTKTVA